MIPLVLRRAVLLTASFCSVAAASPVATVPNIDVGREHGDASSLAAVPLAPAALWPVAPLVSAPWALPLPAAQVAPVARAANVWTPRLPAAVSPAKEKLFAPTPSAPYSAEGLWARSSRLFDSSNEGGDAEAAAIAALQEKHFPRAAVSITAEEHQKRLGREFDEISGRVRAAKPNPDSIPFRIKEIVAFARTIRGKAADISSRRSETLVVPFLSDAEPIYLAMRALEGPTVDRTVRLSYVDRITLKSDSEKLSQQWDSRFHDIDSYRAYANSVRDSEMYRTLAVEDSVVDSARVVGRFRAGPTDFTVTLGDKIVGVIANGSRELKFSRFAEIPREALAHGGWAALKKGNPAGILLTQGRRQLILQGGLMAESRLDARLRVTGSYDPPRDELRPRTQDAFLKAITNRIEALIEKAPNGNFARHALRLYDAMKLGNHDVLFVDTGYKGTIPVLFAALHRIRTGRQANAYLYATGLGYAEAVPSLRIEASQRMLEDAVKFGQLGGFGPDGLALVAASPASVVARARLQTELIVREAVRR